MLFGLHDNLTSSFSEKPDSARPGNILLREYGRIASGFLYVTPADVYFGRDQENLARMDIIKQRTLLKRRLDFALKKTVLI